MNDSYTILGEAKETETMKTMFITICIILLSPGLLFAISKGQCVLTCLIDHNYSQDSVKSCFELCSLVGDQNEIFSTKDCLFQCHRARNYKADPNDSCIGMCSILSK